jgi:exonuclease VII small subunit
MDIAQREGFLLNQELDDMEDMIQRLEEQGIALEKANN